MGINRNFAPKLTLKDHINSCIFAILFIAVIGGALAFCKDMDKQLAKRYKVTADRKEYILHNFIIYSDGIKGYTDEGDRVILKNVVNLSYSLVVEK